MNETRTDGTINPYPGLDSFQDNEIGRKLFFGRKYEVDKLGDLVLAEPQVLFFGRSGLGKTSLINAGLMDVFRKRGYFPVIVRLTHHINNDPVQSVYQRIDEEAEKRKINMSGADKSASLWVYFRTTRFEKDGNNLRPIIILDQFEELFTIIGEDIRHSFVQQLADLIRRRVPMEVRTAAEEQMETLPKESPKRRELIGLLYENESPDVKVLISIREDYLPELEGLKNQIPNIFRHSLRLEPLSPDHAREAIEKPAHQKDLLVEAAFTFQEGAVDEIIKFLRVNREGGVDVPGNTIEPVHLQILCYDLNERRKRRGRKEITKQDLGGLKGMQRIINQYYRRVRSNIPLFRFGWNTRKYRPSLTNWIFSNFPRLTAQRLCENQLITPTGHRNSFDVDYIENRFGMPRKDLEKLRDLRLLRREPRYDSSYYELSHDSLISPLLRVRRRRRWYQWFPAVVLVVVIAAQIPNLLHIGGKLNDKIEIAFKAPPLIDRINDIYLSKEAREFAVKMLMELPVKNLSELNLKGLDLSKISKKFLMFSECNLRETFFKEARLEAAIFAKSIDLSNTSFLKARLTGANFEKEHLTKTNFYDANLYKARFRETVMEGTEFSNAKLAEADFSGATLQSTKLDRTDLTKAKFTNAKLNQVDMDGAKLEKAIFEGATLEGVELTNASIYKAGFSETSLEAVNLAGTAWWHARGWSEDQIKVLEEKFPHRQYVEGSEYYSKKIEQLEGRIEGAKERPSEKADALNGLAWIRAISFDDLKIALQEVNESLEIVPDNKPAMDTRAQIYLMEGIQEKNERGDLGKAKIKFEKAQKDVEKAMGISKESALSEEDVKSLAEEEASFLFYRYGIILEYLEKCEDAKKYLGLADDYGYKPYHEKMTSPRPETCKSENPRTP